jgi:type IV fimbrial biogenesis protein FimT
MLGPLMHAPRRLRVRTSGFTLIELMIVVALTAVILGLAAPAFRDYLLMQRLRSAQAQLVTDLNYARSEAISRGSFVQMRLQTSSTMSCYVIYARGDRDQSNPCDCTAAPPQSSSTDPVPRCGGGWAWIKTVQFPTAEQVTVVPADTSSPANYFLTLSPRTGGTNMISLSESLVTTQFSMLTQVSASRSFKTSMTAQGRVQVCAPSGSTVGGAAC